MLIDEIKSRASLGEVNPLKTTNSNNLLSERTCESFLSILDDKNRAIASLQRQLSNQKKQLNFYLSRGLESSKINQLSETCLPQAIDDNIPVTLAICKFYKNIGMKSRIMCLHERMSQIDSRIESILQTQQPVLREIVNRMYEVTHANGTSFDQKIYFANFAADKCQWDVFGSLLKSTMSLSKELNTFRICCDRLILIEDERNEIVEQVYSLPVEQRLNCNYIIGIQLEKMQLENEMKNIMREQAELRRKIYELGMMDFNLGKLQQECEYSVGNLCSEYRISKLLEELDSDAAALLHTSKEHKAKCAQEIRELKDENKYMQEVLGEIYETTASKTNDENVKLKLEMDNAYFSHLKEIYDKLLIQFESEKEDFIREELQVTEQLLGENEKLNRELLQSEREKHALTASLHGLQKKYKEIQSEYENEIEQLKNERDSYRSQVEDLLAIRSAYAQLIEKQTDISEVEHSYQSQLSEKDRTISELELEKKQLKNKRSYYEEVCIMQKSQIKYLIGLLEKLCEDPEETQELDYPLDKACVPYNSKKNSQTNIPKNKTACNSESDTTQERSSSCGGNSSIYTNLSQNSSHSDKYKLNRKDYSRRETINKKLTKTRFSDKVKTAIIQTSEEQVGKDSFHSQHNIPFRQEKRRSIVETNPSFPTTNLHIQSTQKDGKTEIMKAFIESTSNVEGTFRVGGTSVSLKLDCKPIQSEIPNKDQEIDEYELMKDCSLETIPSVCLHGRIITLEGLKENHSSAEDIANECDNSGMNEELEEIRRSDEPNNSTVNEPSRLRGTTAADVARQLGVIASRVSVNLPHASKKSLILAEVRSIYQQILQGICDD